LIQSLRYAAAQLLRQGDIIKGEKQILYLLLQEMLVKSAGGRSVRRAQGKGASAQ
jgi:hypothetical protein